MRIVGMTLVCVDVADEARADYERWCNAVLFPRLPRYRRCCRYKAILC